MSSSQDLNKTRYTHRDYESVKSDLISAIPSLTQEWTGREESDPGIVLVKLISMFGDTLSYNIDKTALELYVTSVTQRKNCAKILKLLGYKTHWYRSARVVAHLRLLSQQDSQGNYERVILVPYETQLVTTDGIAYTVVNQGIGSGEVDVASAYQVEPVLLVEGTPVTVEFTQDDLINNRYYFEANNVDETEFYLRIEGSSSRRSCQLVDNLYLESSSSSICYEFGIDEYDRPYLQLADNWEDIVESRNVTFVLSYILSSGSRGNVSYNAFTSVRKAGQGSTNLSNLVITNLPNGPDNVQSQDANNSPGYGPQTVEDARDDSANYVFTHDTLITSSDYEKACRRINNITMSKLVDAQVVINDGLDLDELTTRALDTFSTVEVEELGDEPETTVTNKYLVPHQVIMYLGFSDFSPETNQYFEPVEVHDSDWSIYNSEGDDPYDSPYPNEESGYYPYKVRQDILDVIQESLKKLHTLNVKVDFGTVKLFPFKVKGTLHLKQEMSPFDSLQVVDTVNSALVEAYHPTRRHVGDKPNFIEVVDIIQGADNRIKYFDAIDNIIEWARAVQLNIKNFDKIFDTTSAIKYNGLSTQFNLANKYLKYTFRNYPVSPDSEDQKTKVYGTEGDTYLPEDYGTAYLVNYSRVAGISPVKRVSPNSSCTLQLNNIEELRALCEDLKHKGKVLLTYIRTYGDTVTKSGTKAITVNSSHALDRMTYTGKLLRITLNDDTYEVVSPESGVLEEDAINWINTASDEGYTASFEFEGEGTYEATLRKYKDEHNVPDQSLESNQERVSKYTLINNTGLQWREA